MRTPLAIVLAAMVLAGCSVQLGPSSEPSASLAAPSADMGSGPAPSSPSGPPVTASGCSATYLTLNSVDSMVKVRTTLTNMTGAEVTVTYMDVAFIKGGEQVGSATSVSPLSGDTTAGVTLTLAPGATADVTAGTDTINLSGSYEPACQVIQVYSQPGNGQ